MKIKASAISMSSNHQYASYMQQSMASMITTEEQAATLDFSKEGASMVEQMKEQQDKIAREKEQQQKNNTAKMFSQQMQQVKKQTEGNRDVQDEMQLKMELLRKMFKAMFELGIGKKGANMQEISRLKAQYQSVSSQSSFCVSTGAAMANSGGAANAAAVNGATAWTKTTVTSAFVTEMEHTAYQAAGMVKTADGREINFGVTLEMSRAFCGKYESLVQEDYIVTDPLVINLDTNMATVTDQKFLFDLNTDGTQDEISFVGQGSGFLALDKNSDGNVNDGSELFGTRSGDGFKDLAAHDKDHNGWIDENDSVFADLKVWTKDAEGNDRLISLKEAGVGAIYLGNTDTEFSLKNNETFGTNGIIRKTGIFLKESGEVSTVQHVDLAL